MCPICLKKWPLEIGRSSFTSGGSHPGRDNGDVVRGSLSEDCYIFLTEPDILMVKEGSNGGSGSRFSAENAPRSYQRKRSSASSADLKDLIVAAGGSPRCSLALGLPERLAYGEFIVR